MQYDSTRTSLPGESSPNSFIEFGQIHWGDPPNLSSLKVGETASVFASSLARRLAVRRNGDALSVSFVLPMPPRLAALERVVDRVE